MIIYGKSVHNQSLVSIQIAPMRSLNYICEWVNAGNCAVQVHSRHTCPEGWGNEELRQR